MFVIMLSVDLIYSSATPSTNDNNKHVVSPLEAHLNINIKFLIRIIDAM
jgi:hypothetical protein